MSKALDLYDKKEFYQCLGCAICTGSCPAVRVLESYKPPREIILRYILFGEENEVLDNPDIWACTTCHTCQARCPHDIRISGLLTHVMNLAARRGNIPKALRESIKLMDETGWSVQATSRSNRVREELGLKPLERPKVKDIQEIFREAGLDKILDLK